MAELDADARNDLDDSDFAVPKTRQLPIHDEEHVKAAMSRFGQTKFADDATKKAAAKKIVAKAKSLGVKVSDDNPLLSMSENDADDDGDCDTCDGTGKILAGKRKCPDCGGTGDASVDMHERFAKNGAMLRLAFNEAGKFQAGEKRVPYLTTGSWEFDDYGLFEVTPQDIHTVKKLFDEHARRQDIPALLDVSNFGEANEDHHEFDSALVGGGRSVGWIKSLEVNDGRLDAVVECNPVGDQLLANDQYRYVSPELLRNWKDPETGVIYPLVATGLAFTNKPRLKSLGRIAASEGNSPSVAVMAFSEGPATGNNPAEIARAVMAEGDIENPSTVTTGSSVTDPTTAAPTTREGVPMPEPEAPPAETPAAPTEPAPAPAPEPTPAPAEPTTLDAAETQANLSESKAILAAERAARQKLETEVIAMREELNQQKTAAKLAETNARLERLATEGKVTPAEVKTFSEKLPELAGPSAWVLDMMASRQPVIRFGEIGSAKEDASVSDATRLDTAARAFMAERKAQGETVKYRDAVLHVSGAGYRG